MFDPDKVYDPTQKNPLLDPDPIKPKKGKGIEGGFDPSKIHLPSGTGSTPLLGGAENDLNQEEFRFSLKNNADNRLLRAQDQGALETAGIAAANLIPNILTGMGEMVGFTGALATEWGDDRDYSNALTRKMQEWHNPFGEIYKENPDQVIDMGDSAWWIENLSQLAESAAAFALPGGAIGKGFEMAARGASTLLKLGKVGSAIARGAGQVASAAIMGYEEGAMSGYRVYDQAYKTQYQKNVEAGVDPVEADLMAKKVASDAAATTVRLYTGLGAVLNLTAFTPLFKKVDDEAYTWLSTAGKRQAGESVQGWKQRILEAGFDNKDIARIFSPRGGMSGYLSETIQEGGEEFIQGYFDKIGEQKGKGEQLKQGLEAIDDFLSKTMDEEGLLNFALGGLGGAAQTVILDNIPLHRVQQYDAANKPIFKTTGSQPELDSNGNPKFATKLVSSRTRNMDNSKQYFANIKDAIVKDITWFEEKNKQMQETKDPVLKESLRAQMFNVNNLNAVTSGLSDNWKQQYQEVHDIDNTKSLSESLQPAIDEITQAISDAAGQGDTATADALNKQRQELLTQQSSLEGVTEAMQRGFAKNKDDNWYKTQAKQAVADLEKYQEMWDETQKKYGQTEEQKSAGLADYIFAHKVDLYKNNQILQNAEADYAKLESEYMVQHAGLTEDFDISARTYQSEWSALEAERKGYEDDVKKVNSKEVQDKYHGLTEKEIEATLRYRISELNKKGHELNQNLKATFDASPWSIQNPGKGYEDYFKALQDKFTDRNDLNNYKAQIEQHRTRTSMLNSKLNDILTTKGTLNVIKKAMLQKRELVKEMEERNKKDNTEAKIKQRSDAAAKNLNKQQLSIRERELRERIAKVEKDIESGLLKLQKLKDDLAKAKKSTSLLKQLTKDEKIDSIKTSIRILEYDIAGNRIKLEQLKKELSAIVDAQIETAVTGEVAEVQPVPDNDTEGAGTTPAPPEETGHSTPITSSMTEEEKAFHGALSKLPSDVIQVIIQYEQVLKAGEKFSFDEFNKRLAQAGITTQYGEAAVALRDYINSLAQPVTDSSEEEMPPDYIPEFEESLDEFVEPEEIIEEVTVEEKDLTPETETDSPETANTTVEAMGRLHKGKKATSAITIINSTLEYIDYTDQYGDYRIVSPEGKLNPNTPEAILQPNGVKPGDTVTLRITEYNGPTNSNTQANTFKQIPFADFFDKDGRALRTDTAVGNIPIGIYSGTGELLGYLPTQDRLSAIYEGAADLRNMTDDAYPEESRKNLELRRKIVAANGDVTMKVGSKSAGSVIENYEKISDNEYRKQRRSAAKSLPDPSLTIAISSGGNLYENKKDNTRKELSMTSHEMKAFENAPMVLLPMANGQFTPSPLFMPVLHSEQDSTAVNSIMRAIELFHYKDPASIEERNQLVDLTGFDIATPDGLRSYINQYFTYTQKFSAADTLADPKLFPGKKEKFMFNITDTGQVMIGTSFSGRKPLFLDNNNSKQFKEALAAGLATRWKNVVYTDQELGIQGINSRREFNEVVYRGGSWKTIPHANYNSYLKSHATTYVNGTNKLSNGKYVYAANPQIVLDESTAKYPVEYNANTQVSIPEKREMKNATDFSAALSLGIPHFYNQMLEALQKGTNIIGGLKEPLIDKAKPAFDSGEIKTVEDLYRFYNQKKIEPPKNIQATAEDDELAESLGDFNFLPTGTIDTIIEPSVTLTPISLEVLNNLYNFTPSGERNGLSPEMVLEDMIKDGIPYIAEGHNPFMKCN